MSTATADAPPVDTDPGQVLVELRRARRRRRTQESDFFEALYRAYITAVVAGLAVWLLSGVVGDTRLTGSSVTSVTDHGPLVVGAAVAVILAVGARSGGRGGPLVIEAADVRHILSAPVDRAITLRGPAIRQLRFGTAAGAGIGALAGLLAYRRLPGGFVPWVGTGVLVGAVTAAAGLGLAMLVSGRRWGRLVGGAVAVGILAWSAADAVAGTATSPATLLGDAALWPLRFRTLGVIGPVVAVAVALAGAASVAGTSIEASERRASLAGQIRFAATLRDLRTVVVLRRQLSQEQPRQNPWLRMGRSVAPPGAAGGGAGRRRRFPSWRRGWHGILRFPAVRLFRLAVLGGVAGAALVGVWRGTTPLVVVAGLALYVAGLDALEPVAQEIDHPDRTDGYPRPPGVVYLSQAGPSAVLMVAVAVVGWATAVVMTGADHRAVTVGAALVVPAAAGGLCGAMVSIMQGAPSLVSSVDGFLPPEAAGARAIVRIVWPPALAVGGVLPVLVGRAAHVGTDPAADTAGLIAPVLIGVILIGTWVRYRVDIHRWVRTAMDEAGGKSTKPGAARPVAPTPVRRTPLGMPPDDVGGEPGDGPSGE